MQYIISGGRQLNGEINLSGNKNSVFPCIAASLLTDQEVVLENIPHILDVKVLMQILDSIGVSNRLEDDRLIIRAEKLKEALPKDLMVRLRGSIVLVGAILARLGKASFYFPGGDIIGRRGIDVHLAGFNALGFFVKQKDLFFSIKKTSKEIANVQFFHYITSVTATENLILASVLGEGQVILKNCTLEPHIVDLCKMLNLMGADIIGVGTDKITITQVKKLIGVKFRIDIDHLELGTYIIASAITGGKVVFGNLTDTDFDPILVPLARFGILYKRKGNRLECWSDGLVSIEKLQTNIWPGFPTDLMSVAIVLASQSKGITLCHDWIFESRMFFVDKLISMGADITIADPHRVIVSGPSKLKGRRLESPDIRAGMALVLAALVAEGKSTIDKAELVERGYEDVILKLKSLGSDIKKIDDNF